MSSLWRSWLWPDLVLYVISTDYGEGWRQPLVWAFSNQISQQLMSETLVLAAARRFEPVINGRKSPSIRPGGCADGEARPQPDAASRRLRNYDDKS